MKNPHKFYDYLMQQAQKDGIQKIVAGGIIRNKEGKILVMTRKASDDFLPSIDELPSGNLDAGEGLYAGLVREIKEETGMNIAKINGYLDFFDYMSGSGKRTRQFNFEIVPDRENVVLEEHDAYKWQTASEAMANPKITQEVKKCIEIYGFNEDMKSLSKKKINSIVANKQKTVEQVLTNR